jgi:hypothetical protein
MPKGSTPLASTGSLVEGDQRLQEIGRWRETLDWVAKPRPEKKRQKAKPTQPPLPGMSPPEPPGTIRVFPMQLQVGDKFGDESGEWEVIAHPYATVGGKNTNVRVQQVDHPGVTEARTWGSYERVTVIRRVGFRLNWENDRT